MPIEEITGYYPKMALPLYTRIADPKHNQYDVGEVYDIRVEDHERAKETGQDGPFNYVHEAILVAKEEMEVGEIPGPLLAFDLHTAEPSKVDERLPPGDSNKGRELIILVFLRLDMAKEFVKDYEAIFVENTSADDAQLRFTETDKPSMEEF